MVLTNVDYQYSEPQIFHTYSQWTDQEKEQLRLQLEQIDQEALKQQKELVYFSQTEDPSLHEPFNAVDYAGNATLRSLGQQLIEEGQLGCLMLAGGQGTRLNFNGPKGLYPISVVHHKTLFQLCAEKVLAASRRAKRPLLLAIMTSPENDQETRNYFKTHDFFGLEPSQVSFFIQKELPFLDEQGQLILEKSGKLMIGPDGNGGALTEFVSSGLWKEWTGKGVKFLHLILVDNPLADPFDAELLGYQKEHGLEVTLKCTEKKDPLERVGVVVSKKGRAAVVEYSELSEEEKFLREPEGRLSYGCANLSLFCFSMEFIERIYQEKRVIPLHKAWKKIHYLSEKGEILEGMGWKFEKFIFDWLEYAKKVRVLVYPREECFAPLKNFSGADSPETVRQALQERDRKVLENLTGKPAPTTPFEVPAEYYYSNNSF